MISQKSKRYQKETS